MQLNPKSILTLDKLVGRPLCAILSVAELLRQTISRRSDTMPRKIVFIKLIEMGSTVLACSAFEEASKMVGKKNMFILVFEQNRAIVDLLPYFERENVITINDSNLVSFILGLFKAMHRLRREKVDAAIDMEGLTRSSAIITYLTGARRRVGYYNFSSEGPYRGRLFTDELAYNFQHHISRMFLALVRSLKAPRDQVPKLKEYISSKDIVVAKFSPDQQEKEEILALVESRIPGARNKTLILLNPNCSDLLPLRRWPAEKFVALGQKLIAEHADVLIVITGAPGEKIEAEKIASSIAQSDRVCSLAGFTTMRQLLTLYCVSKLLVSNDSGPCHFAALTPINIIALFGPETPLLYAPVSDKATCITANLACSPCVNMLNHRFSPCSENKCMQSISIEQVLDAANKVIS
ncbi:MAG: glycosyltransferase family 9 protein [Lentisphaerae bacterium]|nr:glycosyltransferase family 9 protein [Lentisphaerota bacterium]